MKLYDQHLHSRHSFDSTADPAANVEAACARGLSGLTFTEHFDLHPSDWKTCVYDHDDYTRTIQSLREQFGSRVFIGQGIEVCFQPDRMNVILDFLSRHEFDLVILSVHYFGTRALHRREHWRGIDATTGTKRYLETVLEAAQLCKKRHADGTRVFDVLGHLDLVKRYTQRFHKANEVGHYQGLIDRILTACLDADLIPEVNTSTLRQGLHEPMPSMDTLASYHRLGGKGVTLGSDAHTSADIGAGFDTAQTLLHEAGITHTAVHRGRKREWIPLPPDCHRAEPPDTTNAAT